MGLIADIVVSKTNRLPVEGPVINFKEGQAGRNGSRQRLEPSEKSTLEK